jgi:hypothetical protein
MKSRRNKAGRKNPILAELRKTFADVSEPEVWKAVEALLKRHQQGLDLLADYPIGKAYGSKAIKTVADDWGINEDTLRKMRVFADERKGYSPAELEGLCAECLKYGRPLGFSFIVKFLTITEKRERACFQREAIRNDWSLIRVKHELVARYGRRRRGGKRPAIPATVRELLADLETKCIGWQRLIAVLHSDSNPDTSGLRWQDLPQEVQKRLERAAKAIEGLQEALAEHLPGASS